ncbi:hypothetical protein HPULCUR_006972 [Helicostylum pulchrum]|uniref:Uncharacterized protein n=1 Tax=Helicostylum pulchrum TaxID=562976 RepID=A0ABP9Y3D6_9FUNG
MFVVHFDWEDDIKEELLRLIFIQSSLILKDDHEDRLLFFADLESYFWKHENHDPNATSDIIDSRINEEIRSWIEEHVEKHTDWKIVKALLRLSLEDLAHLGNIANEQSGAAISTV